MIPGTTTLHGLDKDQICTRYQDIFEELGCFENQAVAKNKLDRLEGLGVVAKVEQPTDWVSCLVTVKKSERHIENLFRPKAVE